jgi:RNA polymerase sigma-70 factor (ECF subfamily)
MSQNSGEKFSESTELFKRMQKGDPQAFNQMVREYEKKIFRIAYGFFKDRDEAMEIVQGTFLKVYRNIASYRLGTSFSSWIYRIASNLCIDRYRKNKRSQESSREIYRRTEETRPEGPSQMALVESQKDEIQRALEKLSRRQKMVFSLRYFSHKKMSEISDILGIADGTVKTLHFRALEKIRREVAFGR